MKLQKTLLSTLVAAACVAGVAPSFAAPVFYSSGDNTIGNSNLNDIELLNRENIYRLATDVTCSLGACISSADDPTGYDRVIPGAVLKTGDIFAGILYLRQVSNSNGGPATWTTTVSPVDEFSGYFVQEIKGVADNAAGTERRVLLGSLSVADPFGHLDVNGADNMFGTADDISVGLWTNSATNVILDGPGTLAASIGGAIDGDLWAYLGIGTNNTGTAAAPNPESDGYAWSKFDLTSQTFAGDFYVGYNIIEQGSAFNLAGVRPINDPVETLIGGALPLDPLLIPGTTAYNNLLGVCTPTATYACNDIVGNGQLEANSKLSPWFFASQDPLLLNAIPEPSSIALLGLGLLGLGASLRRRAK